MLSAGTVVVSLLLGYLFIEAAYRAYLYFNYAVQTNYSVSTTDLRQSVPTVGQPGSVYGYYAPGKSFTMTRYAVDGAMVQQHRVRINNLGWVSSFDYQRDKPASEYRIVILGSSTTESITNSIPWPDVLQRKLNADAGLLARLGVGQVTVLNLGRRGAGMQLMANPLALVARSFSPDMVVVNFSVEDIERRGGGSLDSIPPEPVRSANDGVPSAKEVAEPHIDIDGVEIPLYCDRGPPAPSNLTCKVSPVWYVPPGMRLDQYTLNRVKQKAARTLLWHRVVTSPKPLVLLALIGRPVIGAANAASKASAKELDDRALALRALAFMHSMYPHMLVLHNPLYWHLKGQTVSSSRNPSEILDPLIAGARAIGLEVIKTERYLPLAKGEQEWLRWYNLPHDGHWSDYGAQIYGEAVYRLLRERLLAPG